MLAIPVKTPNETSAIAPLFGQAKWFAIITGDGRVDFWHNEARNGRAVIDHFMSAGVDSVVFQDMGATPFDLLERSGIACYHSGIGRITLDDAIAYLKRDALIRVTRANKAEYIERGHAHSNKGHRHEPHHRHHAH